MNAGVWPLPSTKSGFLCAFALRNPHFRAFRAQKRHFCVRNGDISLVLAPAEHRIGIFVRFLPSKPSISGFSSTKSWFLCAFDLQNPHFQAFRAQNRHFCVRMGDFSEIFGRFDTKMGFLCSGREVIGTGKRNRFLPANHRAGFQNVNTS